MLTLWKLQQLVMTSPVSHDTDTESPSFGPVYDDHLVVHVKDVSVDVVLSVPRLFSAR